MNEFLEQEYGHAAVLNIVDSILAAGEKQLVDNRINRQVIPVTVDWAAEQLLSAVNDYFIDCDVVDMEDNGGRNIWEMDSEPPCVPVDSWATGLWPLVSQKTPEDFVYDVKENIAALVETSKARKSLEGTEGKKEDNINNNNSNILATKRMISTGKSLAKLPRLAKSPADSISITSNSPLIKSTGKQSAKSSSLKSLIPRSTSPVKSSRATPKIPQTPLYPALRDQRKNLTSAASPLKKVQLIEDQLARKTSSRISSLATTTTNSRSSSA